MGTCYSSKSNDEQKIESEIKTLELLPKRYEKNIDVSPESHADDKTRIMNTPFSETFTVNDLPDKCRDKDVHPDDKPRIMNTPFSETIPIVSFTVNDLPDKCRDKDVYDLIMATANKTVRITVSIVSPNRPNVGPESNEPYPLYKEKGSNNIRIGTGEIDVCKVIDGYKYNAQLVKGDVLRGKNKRAHKTCPCETCQQSDKPSNTWWEIFVHTAAHLVFDDVEARHTTCDLFYDDQDIPLVTFDKVGVHGVNTVKDKCVLKYVTCDVATGDQLLKIVKMFYELEDKVCHKYMWKYSHISKLKFLVAHPLEGCKLISIYESGYYKTLDTLRQVDFKYESPTLCHCHFSCGARPHQAVAKYACPTYVNVASPGYFFYDYTEILHKYSY